MCKTFLRAMLLVFFCVIQIGLIVFACLDIPQFEGSTPVYQFPRLLQWFVRVVLGVEVVIACFAVFGGIGELLHRLTAKREHEEHSKTHH